VPNDASVLGFAAARAQAAGDAAKAVDLLQDLARKLPDNPVVLNDLAWAQVQASRPEALDNARKAAEALPGSANVLETLGMALAKAGKTEESIRVLRLAANIAPNAASTQLYLSEQLLAFGDRNAATERLRFIKEDELGHREKLSLSKLKAALRVS
jgi:predicted Zn-dependent protease